MLRQPQQEARLYHGGYSYYKSVETQSDEAAALVPVEVMDFCVVHASKLILWDRFCHFRR